LSGRCGNSLHLNLGGRFLHLLRCTPILACLHGCQALSHLLFSQPLLLLRSGYFGSHAFRLDSCGLGSDTLCLNPCGLGSSLLCCHSQSFRCSSSSCCCCCRRCFLLLQLFLRSSLRFSRQLLRCRPCRRRRLECLQRQLLFYHSLGSGERYGIVPHETLTIPRHFAAEILCFTDRSSRATFVASRDFGRLERCHIQYNFRATCNMKYDILAQALEELGLLPVVSEALLSYLFAHHTVHHIGRGAFVIHLTQLAWHDQRH
jgi:hypothetical protein